MPSQFSTLIGVDGGGTGTRVRITLADTGDDRCEIVQGRAGPSGLSYGCDAAWRAVLDAITDAFQSVGRCQPPLAQMAIGLGLAGVHNPVYAADFQARNPGFGALALASDGYITLLGAHDGQPGAIVAIGTGTIGEVLDTEGQHREVSGWGFPAGDEGSGAWLGMRAVNHAQRMLDGRDGASQLGHAIVEACGGSRHSLLNWLSNASPTRFATLAPLVVAQAAQDATARALLAAAAAEIEQITHALDPSASLPISLSGGLAVPLRAFLSASLQARLTAPRDDAAGGALLLLRRTLDTLNADRT